MRSGLLSTIIKDWAVFAKLSGKKIKKRQDGGQAQQQGGDQQAQMQQAQQMKEQDIANENYQNELDRINKKEIALINAAARGESATQDADQSGAPDILEISNLSMQQSKAAQEYQVKMQDIQSKNNQAMQKMQLEKEKLNVARENMKNDVEVAKINASNRASKNNKK